MAVIQYESDVSVRGRVLIYGGLPHQFLKADGSLDSNTYALASSVHNPVTIGTANGLSLSNQQLSLGLASSGVTGALSGTDWNTFNNKQPAITGLTTNYLPKWNGSGFGNSQIFDNGTNVGIGTNALIAKFQVSLGNDKNIGFYEDGEAGISSFTDGATSNAPLAFNATEYIFKIRGVAKAKILNNGNLLVNTATDDLTNKLQVNGTISASPATTANQVVVMSQINGKANADGSNVSGTWGINISGNASSATNWGGRTANLDVIDNNVGHLLQRGNDGVTRLAEASGVRTWLGLGSNAYTSTPYLPLIGGTLTGNLVVASTATSSLNLGSVSSSWAGSISYPTIFGSTPDRWIMHINPHISYTNPGVNGFTGSMLGATIRFASNPGASAYWDAGVGTNGIGEDKFSIGRLGTNFLNITNSGTVQVSNIFDVMGASYLYGGLTVSGSPVARTGYLAVASAIAIGDSDTGFRQNGDGFLEYFGNNVRTAQMSSNGWVFDQIISGNISGNARYINIGTSASISDLNLSVSDHAVRFDTFDAQAANKPISVNNANGVISFLMNHGPQYGKQIAFADNDDLYIRKLSGGTYGNWLSLIHSGNIASQSVNYANSSYSAQISNICTGTAANASSVAWSGVYNKPADWLNSAALIGSHANANERRNSGFYENEGGGYNWPTNGTWYNSINVRHSNPNNYHGFQVAMSYYDNNLWYRSYMGNGTFQAWQRAVGYNELDNYVGKTSGNRPGVTRLYRRDSDEPYNLQHNWTGTHWLLRGYYNDDFHAEVKVEYANSAGSAPNANNQNSSYLVTPGDGNGIKFWASDQYKISMGTGSLYQYGPVTDYSIKMQMDADSPGRGFTWGRHGITPIAALNATSGNFQTTGNMAASAFFQFSDIRLKTVIPHQHVSIENIAPITYLWKDPKKRASPQVGYSAQEVQKVMPYAVSVDDDGMMSVNYIQVLVAKVAELELKLKKHGLE